jgi:TRAP-type C4-dicarboxylate transport system permease small subunit
MDTVKRLLIWIAVAALVVLAVLLPVVVVTGMFGGKPLAGTIALVGLMLLAFGVAWYVHTHARRF